MTELELTVDGAAVCVDVADGATLLDVLREGLGHTSVKDGCAPQGQCGCCTVLVDGRPRVACVTPASRVAGRSITTVHGLAAVTRDCLTAAFVARGASQCGFCTPGILCRLAPIIEQGDVSTPVVHRALAAHLCRCTGWHTITEAAFAAADAHANPDAHATSDDRSLRAASERAALEGGVPQRVGAEIVLGGGGFADDTAPRSALVAVPAPPGSDADVVRAAGLDWVVGTSVEQARTLAGKTQGRRTTVEARPPLPALDPPPGGVALRTSWVEPAYLELDASWCAPGELPATPLANGGAFGAKATSPVGAAAQELAERLGRAVRVRWSREDATRLGPKRPPISATAVAHDGVVTISGSAVGAVPPLEPSPYRLETRLDVAAVTVPGPAVSTALVAPFAEWVVLVEGAIDAAQLDRTELVRDERRAGALLDTVASAGDAIAGARAHVDGTGAITRIDVRVGAGDPLDAVVLRSYILGATHMALGWVLREQLTVDDTGAVLDLTIRSFGVIPARAMVPVHVEILEEPGPPRRRASDAAFAAVAAAVCNAVTRAEGSRPPQLPARDTAAGVALR